MSIKMEQQTDKKGFWSGDTYSFRALIDKSGSWASLVLACFLIGVYFMYVNGLWVSDAMIAFYASVIAIFGRVAISVAEKYDRLRDEESWKINISNVKSISIFVVGFVVLDMIYGTQLISNLFGISDEYQILQINMIIIFLVIALNGGILLAVAGKRSQNISPTIRYTMPTAVLIGSLVAVVGVVIGSNLLNPEVPGVIAMGQMGDAARMFEAVFYILFYSPEAGLMIGFMVIGTLATIFTVNRGMDDAMTSVGVLTMAGIPLIFIVAIFLGMIPAPAPLLEIFRDAPAISSFIYAIAETSAYVIVLSLMMVFVSSARFLEED